MDSLDLAAMEASALGHRFYMTPACGSGIPALTRLPQLALGVYFVLTEGQASPKGEQHQQEGPQFNKIIFTTSALVPNAVTHSPLSCLTFTFKIEKCNDNAFSGIGKLMPFLTLEKDT